MIDESPELEEYFALGKRIDDFVTLSLAALRFGFQYRSYGFFLVAAASSLAFWSLEAVMSSS